jgi:hypothetical protein
MSFAKRYMISLSVILFALTGAQHTEGAPPHAGMGKITVFCPKPTNDNALVRTFRSPVELIIDKKAVGTVEIEKPLTVSLPAGAHIVQLSVFAGLFRHDEETITVSADKPRYFYVYQAPRGLRIGEVDAQTAQTEITGIAPKTVNGRSTVIIYLPRAFLDLGFLDAMKLDLVVSIDGKRSGSITRGEYMAVELPAGRHLLEMHTDFLGIGSAFGTLKQDLVLGAGSTHYFQIISTETDTKTHTATSQIVEVPASEAKAELNGLRKR